jgi:hypothetical protein
MIDFEYLKYWCKIECLDILKDIADMKRFTKDPEIIYSHFNKFDIEKILYLENVRLGFNGHKFRRTTFELIDIINLDVIYWLYDEYNDFLNLVTENN